MKLSEELVSYYLDSVNNPPIACKHKQETVDELYNKIIERCKKRAKSGCTTCIFHWEYVYSSEETKWEKQHKICLEVVKKLIEEGLEAECPDEFPLYEEDYDGSIIQPIGYHHIHISWQKLALWVGA